MAALVGTLATLEGREVTTTLGTVRVRVVNINRAAGDFLGELHRQGRSARTLHTYESHLGRLADAYPLLDIDEVTTKDLRRWLDLEAKSQRARDNRRPNSAATVAQKVTVLHRFFGWLHDEDYIPSDPSYRLQRPKLVRADENPNVLTVSTDDVQRMLAACRDWRERICLHVLVYTGGRRRAVANLRLSDYDTSSDPPTLRFREKGGKAIRKPVPKRLAELLDAAYLAGVWDEGDQWLVPPRGRAGSERRDDRIIWRTVRDVAARAGVNAHVHALRAAFAVHFLESKEDQLVALKELMGHSRIETTMVYLRRLDRQRSMETVVDLDWGEPRAPEEMTGDLLGGIRAVDSISPSRPRETT